MNFQQGLSGLNATSKSLEVIGNNIANAGTYGAKASRAEFADMYANSIGGTGNVGIGVRVQTVAQQFTQGSLNATSNSMARGPSNGEGFFQLKSSAGETLYSRNGQFKVDNEGFIVNGQNQRLQGYGADQQGVIQTGVRTDLQFPAGGTAAPCDRQRHDCAEFRLAQHGHHAGARGTRDLRHQSGRCDHLQQRDLGALL